MSRMFLFATLRQLAVMLLLGVTLAATPAAAVDLSQITAKPNPRLGLSFPGANPANYSAIADAGIGVVRISAAWKRIEPRRGRFDFSGLDRRVRGLQKLGLTPFITFESNANWATQKRTQKVKNATPKHAERWAHFITTVVARYDGDGQDDMPGLIRPVRYWQVANEWVSDRNKSGGWASSADDLIRYVTVARDAVKAEQRNAIFVMGGMAAFNMDVLLVARDKRSFEVRQSWSATSETVASQREMRGAQISQFIDTQVMPVLTKAPFDMASVHLYGPENRDAARLAMMRRVTGKPVLSSECGGPTLDYGGTYSEAEHFRAVIERNLNVLAAGARFCLWFRLGEAKGSTYGNRRTALYDTKAQPKAGVYAYRALARLIDADARISVVGPGHYRIRRGAGQSISIAWGAAAAGLRSQSDMLCLSDAKRGQLTANPASCSSAAMTFAGAGLTSLLSP